MSKTCDIENQKEDENHLEEIKKDIEAARKQRSKFKATATEETNSSKMIHVYIK